MCEARNHRYRVEIKSRDKEVSLIIYAKHISEAIAKADAWAFENIGADSSIQFNIGHAGYSSREIAIEHGAIFDTIPGFSQDGQIATGYSLDSPDFLW